MMNSSILRRLDAVSRLSFFSYAASVVVLPVTLVAITTELNLTLTQAGTLSLVSSISIFGGLPTSVPAAAVFGKIRLLRISLFILAAGLLLFTQTNSYGMALVCIVVIALGQAVLEALLTPLVEDLYPADNGSKMLQFHAMWSIGTIFGAILAGEALTQGLSWRSAFIFIAVLCITVGTLYPSRKKARLPRSRADFSHVGALFSEPLFWMMGLILFASGGTEGAFAFWSATYIQLEFGSLPRGGGTGVAIFALGMASGRLVSSQFTARFGLKRLLIACAMGTLVFSIGFFLVRQIVPLYVLMALIGFTIAPLWPSVQTYAVRRMHRADPTMLMVFLSCFGILGHSSASFLMGIIGDMAGLRISFLIAPLMSLLLLVLFYAEGQRKSIRFG